MFTPEEILETIRMVQIERLDIRTVTLGIDLADCADVNLDRLCRKVRRKLRRFAGRLVEVVDAVQEEFGVPVVNRRIAVTPIALVASSCRADDLTPLAQALDEAAAELGVDFIGGYSALVHKGATPADQRLIASIPGALASTQRVCSSVNLASTRTGINMDAVVQMGRVLKEAAQLTADHDGRACCKLAVFANAVEDNPFMAGAFHGVGEAQCAVNVGVSGPGVVRAAMMDLAPEAHLGDAADLVKKTAFKITRMGELVGRTVSERLGVDFGIVDLSLAPTPTVADSVAEILELMGLERCGTHGSVAALALLVDAVKKGGAMASSYVGGLSGTFIPVSEDVGMIRAVQDGAMSLAKLEAMTSVCSVGLDMVALPGSIPAESLAAIIADELAIGVVNNKTTGARLIPVPGKEAGDIAEFGGLLGRAPVMDVSRFDSSGFVLRAGRIPAPLRSLTN
ncbi:MAG: PFL family protein [Candidatus Brocadiia bacterium]